MHTYLIINMPDDQDDDFFGDSGDQAPPLSGHDVYISYSWGFEAVCPLVESLKAALRARGHRLILDKERMHYGDSIPRFMQEIGEAPIVIVILSEQYLGSAYCMNEWAQIQQNFGAAWRAHVIVGGTGAWINPVVVDGQEKPLKERLKKSWKVAIDSFSDLHQQGHALLDPKISVDQMKAIVRAYIRPLIDDLEKLLWPRSNALVAENFSSLLDRFPKDVTRHWVEKLDDAYTDELFRKIEHDLRSKSDFSTKFFGALRRHGLDFKPGVLSKINDVIDRALTPVSRDLAMGIKSQVDRLQFIEFAKDVLQSLVLLSVQPSWVRGQHAAGRAGNRVVRLNETCRYAVCLASARVQQKHVAFDYRDGDGEAIRFDEGICLEKLPPSGLSDHANWTDLAMKLWNRYVQGPYPSDKSLADVFRGLNRRFEVRDSDPMQHVYLPVEKSRLESEGVGAFCKAMSERLPQLTVVIFGYKDESAALAVPDEDLQLSINEFLRAMDAATRLP